MKNSVQKSAFRQYAKVLTAVLALAFFAACSKDNDSLSGTTWKGAECAMYTSATLTFPSGSAFSIKVDDEGHLETFTGTYVYNAPSITFTMPDPDDDQIIDLPGTVNGNSLTITYYAEVMAFTKF